MMKRKYLLILLMLAGLFSFADEVQFSMSAPSIVTVGEQFSLTLSLNAKGDDLRMPEINNFDILIGPECFVEPQHSNNQRPHNPNS